MSTDGFFLEELLVGVLTLPFEGFQIDYPRPCDLPQVRWDAFSYSLLEKFGVFVKVGSQHLSPFLAPLIQFFKTLHINVYNSDRP